MQKGSRRSWGDIEKRIQRIWYFKERLVKKLIKRCVRLYIMVEEVISKNAVKLKLLVSMRIHPVVNISRVVRYRELIKRQKVKEPKPIEVNRVKKWKVEKI